jgi:hypothetical protein
MRSPIEPVALASLHGESYSLSYQREDRCEDAWILILLFGVMLTAVVFASFEIRSRSESDQSIPIPKDANHLSANFRLTGLDPNSGFIAEVSFSGSSQTRADVNLTALLRGKKDGTVVLSKGIHQRDLQFASPQDSYVFFSTLAIGSDDLELTFSVRGSLGGFSACVLALQSLEPIPRYAHFFISETVWSVATIAVFTFFAIRIWLLKKLTSELQVLLIFFANVCLVDAHSFWSSLVQALPIAAFFGFLVQFSTDSQQFSVLASIAAAAAVYAAMFWGGEKAELIAQMSVALGGVALALVNRSYRKTIVLVLDAFVVASVIARMRLRGGGSVMVTDFLSRLTVRVFALGIAYLYWPCEDPGERPYTPITRK